ncbi:MAG TPA: alpha-2-macroglobulin family protein [Pyrinomonadaceae bacterium]
MKNDKSLICLLLVYATLLGSLAPVRAKSLATGPNVEAGETAQRRRGGRAAEDAAVQEAKRGLRFRLSEGKEQAEKREAAAAAPATERLSESETQSVLKRLPAIAAEATDEQQFALRERSLPPPRTGKTINISFPQAEARAAPESAISGPLEVLRFSPEGSVPLAPQLSVTFSQPMVAVTSQAELSAQEVPVRLSPQPQGKWRWVGTKTLLFVPDGRFPMASVYSVTVPANTKSATGGALSAAKSWSFMTPPPQVQKSYPQGDSNPLDALMFVEFDQRIDPASVLRTIKVQAGRLSLKTRLATAEEVAADESVSSLVKASEDGRWMAFRAVDAETNETRAALPFETNIKVSIGPGTPSAEGPRTTDKAQDFSFRTHGALRVVRQECGYNRGCSPFDTWTIQFSNTLDAEAFQTSQVRIEPAIPGIKMSVYGNTLQIEGIKQGRRIYRVTLDRSLKDEFGQTLERDASLTFNVGAAPKSLAASGEAFIILDPNGPRSFSVYSINHRQLKANLYAVGPEHWDAFMEYMRWSQSYNTEVKAKYRTPPGRLVFSKELMVNARADEPVETRIDLSPALNGNLGHVIVIIEPVEKTATGRAYPQQIHAWIQSTNIGLDAFVDQTDLIGWTTSLKDGEALAGVQLSIQPAAGSAQSGANGLARLALPPESKTGRNLLVARQGRDVAILPENTSWWDTSGGWFKKETGDFLRWYVFDDRKMYRPGEEVHIKGWIRRVGSGKGGDVGALGGSVRSLTYTLKDSRGNEITKGTLKVNSLGGFDTVLKLPPTMNLGYAALTLLAQDNSQAITALEYTHNFQVQEFRRPEFEVTAQASEGPLFVGGSAETVVAANYYAGGGLANTEVRWNVTSRPGSYTPPNRGDYTFGKWVPWWVERTQESETNSMTYTGLTDAAGKHRLHIDFDSVNPARPSNVTAEASVTDVNRQTWTASASMLVHPADLYVGLKSDRTFVQKGEPLIVQTIVTDLDGQAVTGREVRMRAALLDWVFEKGEWKQQETSAQECSVRSAADAVKCTFETKEGGTYRVNASVMDQRERRNESELTLWVAGGKQPPRREVEQETVELIPDRKDYQPGETAQVLVQSPFYPAEGVLTLRRSGILRTERFRMDGPSYTLRVPVEEGFTPNVYVQVDLVGAAARTDDAGKIDEQLPKRPAFAKGSLNLPVPPLARKLNVKATPREKSLEPGALTVVNVEVQDAAKRPVAGSEVAVVVVDESVLALTNYHLEDPLSIFYALRDEGASDYHLRSAVLLGNPEEIANLMRTEGVGGAGGGSGPMMNTNQSMVTVMSESEAPPAPSPKRARRGDVNGFLADGISGAEPGIRLRENFNALAVFAASVPTDANGRAQVQVKIPDNLTRYRVMAVSVAGGKQFGAGESAITARLPLMARPSAPRFLNFGDRFELPVILQNQTDQEMRVDVAVRATNAELTEGAGRRVKIPANDRVEVRFPAAAVRAGTARFQIGALAGRASDAAEISLPVWTPATTEAFATYGEIDEGAIVQPVQAPGNVVRQFGGLEITTSSTQLQALTDAVLYLVAYPYECSEQLASRVLAVAALRDVLAAFKAKGLPPPAEMQAAVARDIKRLQGLQNDDGGFAFWRRGDESWPYVSIHAAHALERAKEKGFDVPPEMLQKSQRYLREIEKRIPRKYSPQARRALTAYALYVRQRMNDRDAARARRLIAEAGLDGLSLEAVGWLLSVLSGDAGSKAEVEAIRRHLNNRATETAATAQFTASYGDEDYLLLYSSRRADGIILEALIKDQPQNDLIPKLARGLLAHRKQGRWENTQENVFILLALDQYFAAYEKVTPDFVARAWLGEGFAGEQQFRGRTTDRQQVNVPMQYLVEHGAKQNLVLSKEGPGRLYYRIGMQYAPATLKLDAADYGFTVERIYEALDDAQDVRLDADGSWHIKAGSRVRVRLTMSAPARRYHVALVDPLPAGLEALNPALAVTGTIPEDEKNESSRRGGWWWRQWYEHQNLRDERAEAFTSLLWEGVYTYSYVTRATTPGVFVVPPTKAEEMYHPETFGRGKSDRVIVE